MAWGRKKSGGRKEPRFGLAAALADLRLTAQDRIPSGEEDKPKKASARRKTEEPKADEVDDDDPPQRERKPRESRSRSKRRSRSRSRLSLSRLFYWTAVLGLWAAI